MNLLYNSNMPAEKSPNTNLFAKVTRRLRAWKIELITGLLWGIVGNIPSHILRRFFYRLAGMTIKGNGKIHMGARIYYPKGITIGSDTIIGEKATLDGRGQLPNSTGKIIIGEHTDIASEVMIWTSEHDLSSPNWQAIEAPVTIGDYCFIGPRAIILPGVKIGKGAVVAAGAIVTKDVPAMAIVAGIPAKVIGKRESELNYQLGRARLFQ